MEAGIWGICRKMAKHAHFQDKRTLDLSRKQEEQAERKADMWYAIQTITGKEEKAIDEIEKVIESHVCERCLLLKREAVWRIRGACRIHTENLFPGYLFVQTQYPEEFYRQLRTVPQYTRLLGKEDGGFYPVSKEEELFLKRLLNKDRENTVRLSTVSVDKDGTITECDGPLRHYLGYVVKKRIRLRYVIIRVYLFGREREILLGIRLEGDSVTLEEKGGRNDGD